jgi:hypothetical protein
MSIHTDSEAHPVSYSVGIVGRFQIIERPVRESDHPTNLVSKFTISSTNILSQNMTS